MPSDKMSSLRSCGFLIFRDVPAPAFLLMKHKTRWDLPKGHVDPGETDFECAIRELEEETGIRADQIQVDDQFRFELEYEVQRKRDNGETRLKSLRIYLALLLEPEFDLRLTEHIGFEWTAWRPPHQIQTKTIDPLMEHVEHYLRSQPSSFLSKSN